MDLKGLKKEALALPDVSEHARLFRRSWLSHARMHIAGRDLRKKITAVNMSLTSIQEMSVVTQKIQSYVNHLIDLKLSQLTNDAKKKAHITKMLLKDDFLSLSKTIEEVKELEKHISFVEGHYLLLSEYMHAAMDLESSVVFLDGSHKESLLRMKHSVSEQKKILKKVGKEFVKLARKK